MKAYCLVPEDLIDEITECGMDLSLGQDYSCKVTSGSGRCFTGRLNPRDYSRQELIPGTVMIKVNLSEVRAFIGEEAFLKCDGDDSVKFRLFEDSILPSDEYKPGTYRNPLCLIVNAVLPEAVETYDRFMDEAIPYETSEELFLQCLFADALDTGDSFRERALITWLDILTEEGKMKKVSMGDNNVYFNPHTNRPYILRKG